MLAFEPVSVVITCYNLEQYIGAAIDSVIAQDYGGNIEIVVVDDRSTDGSVDVIRRYPHVDLVQLAENGGVLNAMIAGIRRASHDIVMLLDGDDVWEVAKVSETARALERDPGIALATHDLRYIDGNDNPIEQSSRVAGKFRNVPDERCSDVLVSGILEHSDYVWLGSALSFRRSRCEIDGFVTFCDALPDSKNTYQDWPLAFWIASMPGTRMAIVRKPLFKYRVHGRNHSGDSTTIAKALKNSRRALNTALAIQCMSMHRPLNAKVRTNVAQLVRYYRFMFMCYSGLGARAVIPFILSAPLIIRQRRFSKELIRLLFFNLLSPDRALRLLNTARDRLRTTSLSWVGLHVRSW